MEDENVRTVDLVAAPALDERAVQEFARSMRAAVGNATEILGGTTRRESEVSLSDILEPTEADELTDLLGTMFALRSGGTMLGVFHVEDVHAVGLADLFLGGPGTGEDRPPADIEIQVITRTIATVLAPIVSTATFTATDDLAAVPDKDLTGLAPYLVRADITITVAGAEVTGAIYVRDPDRAGSDPGSSEPVVTASAATMPLDLDIELASVEMPAADIGSLAIGDVVVFDVPADAPVRARHESETLFEGMVRVRNDRRMLEVTGVRST